VGFADLLLPPTSDPRPLLFGPGKLGIIWSAKSACTTVLLWYLWHCDLLRAARFYHSWPHQFRNRVLYQSKTYRAWAADVESDGWWWLRILRDPYKRAVSSYRHAVRNGYEDGKIARMLRIDPAQGYSFEQFLDYLQQIDVAACNLHHRVQLHPVEHLISPRKVINIDRQDLMACLGEIDSILPPPKEPVSTLLGAIADIAESHFVRASGTDVDHASTSFRKEDTWSEWPAYRCFLNASTRRKIESIYATDFDRYAAYL
jgi:hypothetical protein